MTEVPLTAVSGPAEDIVFEPDGTILFVYSDTLATLFEGGEITTTRASHVEPHPHGGWYADMSPLGGPVLHANMEAPFVTEPGSIGFGTRQEALDAERAWIRKELGL